MGGRVLGREHGRVRLLQHHGAHDAAEVQREARDPAIAPYCPFDSSSKCCGFDMRVSEYDHVHVLKCVGERTEETKNGEEEV